MVSLSASGRRGAGGRWGARQAGRPAGRQADGRAGGQTREHTNKGFTPRAHFNCTEVFTNPWSRALNNSAVECRVLWNQLLELGKDYSQLPNSPIWPDLEICSASVKLPRVPPTLRARTAGVLSLGAPPPGYRVPEFQDAMRTRMCRTSHLSYRLGTTPRRAPAPLPRTSRATGQTRSRSTYACPPPHPAAAPVLGSWVGVQRRFHLSLFLTASRMVLPKILVLTSTRRGPAPHRRVARQADCRRFRTRIATCYLCAIKPRPLYSCTRTSTCLPCRRR